MAAHDPGFLPPELATDEPPISEEELASEHPPTDRELEAFGQVEWAFRRLAQSQARLDELAEQYADQVGRIEAWYESQCAPERSTVSYLSGLIERYAIARRTREPDGPATFAFPSGKVPTRRTTEPSVVVEDEKALIEWLAERPAFAAVTCRVSLHPRITDLRARVAMWGDGTVRLNDDTDDAPIVPGLAIQPPGITVGNIQLTQEDNDQ